LANGVLFFFPDGEPLSEEALAGLGLCVDAPGAELYGVVQEHLQLASWQHGNNPPTREGRYTGLKCIKNAPTKSFWRKSLILYHLK
jgi:hypothetical protein